mgnify:CR=1 FL=1
MIRTIIFDFGAIFINLDKMGFLQKFLETTKINSFDEKMILKNQLYEQGLISTEEFLDFYTEKFPFLSKAKIVDLWNSMLLDFPKSRFDFIKKLSDKNQYKVILLSNTNELHISWIQKHVPFYEDFKAQFDAFYLSHEIHLRKPNHDIYKFVLQENELNASECLFIDDTKENTEAARDLGIQVWNLDEKKEEVTQLFDIKKDLF